jgi:uroporphyrinogen-III synthase
VKVWITRTLPAAERTAQAVRALGHDPVVAPVLTVRPLRPGLELSDVAALAVTSGNGIGALAALTPRRDLPVFAVGAATAAAARAAGFAEVVSADGDVEALAALLAAVRPRGVVLHAAGRPLAGDLVGALAAAGLRARSVTLYETVASSAAWPDGVDVVLVHSAHAARVLAQGRTGPLPVALAISPAAAAPLEAVEGWPVRVASAPSEAELLELLAAVDLA